MRRFARDGVVLYINSLVMQKPNIRQGRKLFVKIKRKVRSIFAGCRKGDGGFWVYSPFSIPLHHIKAVQKINLFLLKLQISRICRKLKIDRPIVWVACPTAAAVAIGFDRSGLVYQRTDIYEDFPNADHDTISSFDRELKARADLTVFVNRQLYEKEGGQCRNALYLDHGVDFEFFSTAGERVFRPGDMARLNGRVAGFYGGIDEHTFDMKLMEDVVRILGEIQFVFIGNASIDCSGLSGRGNVLMLGKKPYEQIPDYAKFFDVAIMPWRQNRWISVCNPVKLKEYLALGKPVVSTPFSELEKYEDVVYVGRGAEEFASCILQALREDNELLRDLRRQRVASSTWDSKAEILKESLLGAGIEIS